MLNIDTIKDLILLSIGYSPVILKQNFSSLSAGIESQSADRLLSVSRSLMLLKCTITSFDRCYTALAKEGE